MKTTEDRVWLGTLLVLLFIADAWLPTVANPLSLDLEPRAMLPAWVPGEEGSGRVSFGEAHLVARVGTFVDEPTAYLYWDYLTSRRGIGRDRVYLTAYPLAGVSIYELYVRLDNDVLPAASYMESLRKQGYVKTWDWRMVDPSVTTSFARQTRTFETVYNLPVTHEFALLQPERVIEPLARFLLFKSRTDRRVRLNIAPVPPVLTPGEARRLARDIVSVASFFDLPLDQFLGIGAIENNYMTIAGDLRHGIWKTRPQDDDIVLARRRGRVLVLNYACGVWQITRETLRDIHRLHLKEKRDYTALPEHLRPGRQLPRNIETSPVLTTYAGLFFRNLLDYFEGDLPRAVGAYNGGKGRPNLHYANGVQSAAAHVRKVLEQSNTLDGRKVTETRFFAPSWPEPQLEQIAAQ